MLTMLWSRAYVESLYHVCCGAAAPGCGVLYIKAAFPEAVIGPPATGDKQLVQDPEVERSA